MRDEAAPGRRVNADPRASTGTRRKVPTVNRIIPDDEDSIRSRRSPDFNRMFPAPLTEAQRRFWTLRDSGYTGWIDQDGYPVGDEAGGSR